MILNDAVELPVLRKGSAVVSAGVAAEASFGGMQRNLIRHMSVYVSKPDIAGNAHVAIGLDTRPHLANLQALGAGLARRQSIQPIGICFGLSVVVEGPGSSRSLPALTLQPQIVEPLHLPAPLRCELAGRHLSARCMHIAAVGEAQPMEHVDGM